MTLNQLISVLKLFAENHLQISSFIVGDPQKVKGDNTIYPLMVVLPQPVTIGWNSVNVKLHVLLLDRLKADMSNQKEVYSDMLEVGKDLKSYLQNNNLNDIILADDITFEPISDSYNADYVSGWGSTFEIRLEFHTSVCDIPGIGSALEMENNIISVAGSSNSIGGGLTCDELLSCSGLLNVLSTKANISGNTSFVSKSISATTFYSGSTEMSSLFPYDIHSYRKKGKWIGIYDAWYDNSISPVLVGANVFATGNPDNYLRLIPFIIGRKAILSGLAMNIMTAGSSGSTMRFGVYSSDSDMNPSNLVVDAGTVQLDYPAVLIANCNALLNPGLYWFAFIHNSTIDILMEYVDYANQLPIMGYDITTGGYVFNYLERNHTYGVLPSSVSGLTFGLRAGDYTHRFMYKLV